MSKLMRSIAVLAAEARRLNLEAGAPSLPSLYFLTDPERTPDPCAAAARLPGGTAVIYRHFGAPDRVVTARRLARLCARRGLILLISADPALAARVGAHGVHWPENRLPRGKSSPGLVTVSAHGAEGVAAAARFGADACILSPVFPTVSAAQRPPLGLFGASRLARNAGVPVIALGGISSQNAHRLRARGFAGLGAVEALSC